MAFNKNILYGSKESSLNNTRNIFYGEVVSIDDPTDGGIIKVKIPSLDNGINDINNLPDSYPLLPKYLHIYPKVGEYVRIFIEDIQYVNRGRYWIGSIISQLPQIYKEYKITSLSTTKYGYFKPDIAPSSNINSKGVFPEKDEIGIIGRLNTDIILRDNQVEFRAGKHENGDPYILNKKNPASISLNFDQINDTKDYYSNNIIMADKIALISHDGIPKLKSVRIDNKYRTKIFEESHPIARGDVLVEALNILRNAIINHIHGYSKLPADKNSIIKDLEKINFSSILQKNIVIN
jgi:hypothetical protein